MLLKIGLLASLFVPLTALVAFQPQEPTWYYLLHALVCLSLTGFDGTLTQQSPETNQWLHTYFVLGTFVTFASAALLSQFIRLRNCLLYTSDAADE